MKHQFTILVITPHYNMDMQAHIAPALAAIHNLIWLYNLNKILDVLTEAEDAQLGVRIQQMGDLALGPERSAGKVLGRW